MQQQNLTESCIDVSAVRILRDLGLERCIQTQEYHTIYLQLRFHTLVWLVFPIAFDYLLRTREQI